MDWVSDRGSSLFEAFTFFVTAGRQAFFHASGEGLVSLAGFFFADLLEDFLQLVVYLFGSSLKAFKSNLLSFSSLASAMP